jgi:hypothetical protein
LTRHLLVIGAQRSGTTYLHSLLDAHPEITMARPAHPEPKVFLSGRLAGRGLDWYRATYFAHATTQRLLGDKSTSYIEDPQAAQRAAAMLGTAEIVVLLRDPIARAVSNWRFSTDNGLETRPLVRALEDNLEGSDRWRPGLTSVSPYAYLERGRFDDYLDPWFAAFPASVHVLFLADLLAAGPTVSTLYAELGVDPAFRPPGLGQPVNQSAGSAPRLDAALVARLRRYFHDSDEALTKRLCRPLPWRAA